MIRLSRGQIVALVTIALIFSLAALLFDKITNYKANKIDYLTYDKAKPNTLLKGNYLEYVNLGDNYIEKGLNTNEEYAVTYSLNGSEVNKIDTSDFGTYQVKYYLPNKQTITRTIIIIDKKSPSISVPDKQTITSAEAASFDLTAGVIATDNSGNVKLTYDNTLSTIPGDYIITYKAKDNSGNKTLKKRLIKVEAGIEFNYNNNILTIKYPTNKKNSYIYKYSIDGGNTFIETSQNTQITMKTNNIIAAVYENNNYIISNTFNIN